ncbi:hypothetical protein IGI04_002780 [Brassica rapa subsp. trilocularis]|uniref:Uncharacterized protein n=1 Tax=Brassica rapa subsp. trilocularis TaxID=1813537 RepID=A0ABQ7NWK0_BRACM|nr:hypothetical protein IGI04_002780 [Brassica rapa subsp. trilocularis]
MGSSVITSLSLSFKQVPPTAVPAFLDSVLSSTGVSPSTLFESLIKELPFRAENTINGDKKFTSDDCNHIASLVSVGVSMGMLQQEESDFIKWGELLLRDSLTLLFKVTKQLERLLSQSVEHRSCAVSFLLPAIFKAFSSQSSLKISLQGNVYIISSYKFQEWLQENNMGMLQEAVLGWINRGLSSGSWTDGTESYVLEKGRVEFDFRSEHELVLGRNQERLDMAKVPVIRTDSFTF